VARDGAFTSRRGPGEGSVARQGGNREAGITGIRGRQAVPLQVVGVGLAAPTAQRLLRTTVILRSPPLLLVDDEGSPRLRGCAGLFSANH
jgi:hypothetical protein